MHTGKNDSAAQRYTLGTFGLVASLVLLAVSATMNFRFGYSLGKTDFDGQIYGWASVAADVFKALSPFFLFYFLREKLWPLSAAAFTVWIVTTAYGSGSALGHAALNRMDTASARSTVATSYKDARTEIAEARKERGFIPQHRPEATVRAEMEKHKTNRTWSQSNECSEATGKSQRDYCSQYHTLNAELGYAMQAVKLDARIEKLTARSDTLAQGDKSVAAEADPQASVFSRLFSQEVSTIQIALTIAVAVLLEIGGGLGPYTSISYMVGRRREANAQIADEKADKATVAGTDAVTALEPVPEPKALPAPLIPELPAVRVSAPDPVPVLEPVTVAIPQRLILLNGADRWLKEMKFPLHAPRPGALDDWPSHAHAAKCFACWLRAHGQEGPFSHNQILELWARCCTAYHKEQLIWNQFKGSFEKVRGVEWRKVRIDGQESPRPMRWFISTPEAIAADIKRFAKAEPDPKQEAAADPGHRPLARASAPLPEAANDNRKRVAPAWLEMERLESRQMKAMHQQQWMKSRKQRGPRVARMGRAA